MESSTEKVQRDFGPQLLDSLLNELGLTNRDLVEASTEQLTHKQVQRARKGRRLTRNMQEKIGRALVSAVEQQGLDRMVETDTLFNYRP